MSIQLFIQKFHQGEPVTLLYDEVTDCLAAYGVLGRGPVGDIEITFKPDEIAHYGLLVGEAAQGVQCVALIRPTIDNAMRQLVFELMTRFGACLFDDALGIAYGLGSTVSHLPPELAAACRLGVQPISSPQQLWPDGLFFQDPVKENPALIFQNPNPQGIKYVLFDRMEAKNKVLVTEFAIKPEACNPATLRVLRNMLLKVDTALSSNPSFGALYYFTHHEVSLRVMESPQIAEAKNKATFVVSGEAALFGEEEVSAPFIFDPELYFINREKSVELHAQAQAEFNITIQPDAAGIAALEKLLELLHQRYLLECGGRPAGHLYSENALRWAHWAGSFLGERIRSDIGGQWGRLQIIGRETLVVQTHTGRTCWPKQKVLSRIINGSCDSISDYFAELLENVKTPSDMDIVADIVLISHILTGRGNFSGGGLPLAQQLPSSELDFSVQSLHALDAYLAAVRAKLATFKDDAINNLTLGAGAYIGEVFRRNASKDWCWVNYADYASSRPPNPDLPNNLNSCAMLVGQGAVVLPMQAGNVRVWALFPKSAYEQVREWLDNFNPAPLPEAALEPQAEAVPQIDIQTDIRACVAALKPQERGYVQIRPPEWIHGDQLERLFQDYPTLLSQGRVVWAHLVQANNALFKFGMDDAPAEILYDPRGLLGPEELAPIAHKLFLLKNTRPSEPESAQIAAHLTAEITRAFSMKVPSSISSAGLCLSTLFIARAHLPNRRLSLSYFPVLVSDLCAGSTMILPGRWWPKALAEKWGVKSAPERDEQTSAVTPPSVTAPKNRSLHVVESPVPSSDTAAWAHLDKLLEQEDARLVSQKSGFLRKLFGRKFEADPTLFKRVFVKYLSRMAKEFPGAVEAPADLGGNVLTLTVAAESVNYAVETARREFGLTVFDSSRFNIIYRPARK